MHERLYAGVLRLYPADWREEFGSEMRAVFADAVRAAQRRGSLAVVRLWWREIAAIPMNAIRRHDGGRPNPIVASALLLVAGAIVSDLVAATGLFHVTSLVMLAAGLLAAGFIYGTGRRVAAMTLLALTLALSFGADRLATQLAPSGVTSTLSIPGVRLDVSRVDSLPLYRSLIERASHAGTARVRTSTFTRDGSLYLTTVRSGGVDGAYALLTMLLLAATAWTGARTSRGWQLTG